LRAGKKNADAGQCSHSEAFSGKKIYHNEYFMDEGSVAKLSLKPSLSPFHPQ
jgi:hypothetical protein